MAGGEGYDYQPSGMRIVIERRETGNCIALEFGFSLSTHDLTVHALGLGQF